MDGAKTKGHIFHSVWLKVVVAFILILLPVYFLGAAIFHWAYRQMHQQIIRSQMAQLNLYAGTIDAELSRIRLLENHCINDDDLVYLANAYDIMDTFERSQYMLRAQHRMQVMRNSSVCIDRVVLHLPNIGRSIDTRNVESLASNWKEQAEVLACSPLSGLALNTEHELEMSMQYPITQREGREPSLVLTLTLSNSAIQQLLQGFDSTEDTGLVLTSKDNCFALEKTGNQLFLQPELLSLPHELPFTEEITVDGKHFQRTGVLLPESGLVLISFSSTEYLFGFGHTYFIMLVWLGVIAVIAMGAFVFFVRYLIHKPISTLVDSFKRMKSRDFDVRIHRKQTDEFAYLYDSFNDMMDHLQQLIDQVYEQKLLTQRAELKQLQAQINPHFLYNGFYNIYRMAQIEGCSNIAEFSQLMSEYYQYITRNASDIVTMQQEIRHATTYLKIQQIRFSNRLSIHVGAPPDAFDLLMVPRLILQPLLENAFEHGLKNVMEPELLITFEKQGNIWLVQVEDNGAEFQEAELAALQQKLESTDSKLETTALVNIHRRLRYHFGPQSGLKIARTPGGGMKVQLYIVKEVQDVSYSDR